jgi:hypothetical protein
MQDADNQHFTLLRGVKDRKRESAQEVTFHAKRRNSLSEIAAVQ